MKVGIIGLGDIATKAYLPIITSMSHEVVLCSRTQDVTIAIAKQYRIKEYCFDYKELLEHTVDAVFIHAASSSHYSMIKFFLEHNIHVFVDKPISWYLEETMEVYELAKDKGLVLMVGFNRRYSPKVKNLLELEKPSTLIIQKNRHNLPGDIRQFIYDDFIHVVDTLLYLFQNQEKEFDYNGRIVDNQLQSLALILQGEGATAFGSMNRMSGIKEEKIEYISANEKHCIENLDYEWVYKDNKKTLVDYDDWTPTLNKRGFEELIHQFLAWTNTPDASLEALELSLRTHEVCEYLVMEFEESTWMN